MLERKYCETDGRCFADKIVFELADGGCEAMFERHPDCGTYNCPFYKPQGCEDWIKLEHKDRVEMYTPEELMADG